MTGHDAEVRASLARIKETAPVEDVQRYLADLLDEQLDAVAARRTSMGAVAQPLRSPQQSLASARRTVELLDDPQRLADRPEGIVDLGVIEWLLRPAFLLRDGLFEPLSSGPWADLRGDLVQQVARSVCRIDVVMGTGGGVHVGTGFLVGTDQQGRFVVMTNAHVVNEVRMRLGWPDVPGLELACDFACEADRKEGTLLPLSREYRMHTQHDLALLFLPVVRDTENAGALLPLPIARIAPSLIAGFPIGVLGHPSFNSNLDPFPRLFGFGDLFGVKRFSPGYIRASAQRTWLTHLVEVVLHDASTLSGSSGSCVLDMKTGQVLGLHFGGWPLASRIVSVDNEDIVASLFEANGAVPLWKSTADTVFQGVTLSL